VIVKVPLTKAGRSALARRRKLTTTAVLTGAVGARLEQKLVLKRR
jgi:hypothetical protein